jgi:hypothetical protein
MANTILLDIIDDEATQNAFANVSEGQTVRVQMQVLISEISDERIAGTIRMPVTKVDRQRSDVDEQTEANELDEDEAIESETPGGVLRSMVE